MPFAKGAKATPTYFRARSGALGVTLEIHMHWLTDLLENLSISRSTTGAVFITALTLLFGSKAFPEHFQPLPTEYQLIVVAAAVFSGVLLLFWLVSEISYNAHQLATYFWRRIHQKPLNSHELEVVLWLAKKPIGPTDIGQLDYDSQPHTELELRVLLDGLVDRGLVEYVAINDLVILTSSGCKLALELQRKERGTAVISLGIPIVRASTDESTPLT